MEKIERYTTGISGLRAVACGHRFEVSGVARMHGLVLVDFDIGCAKLVHEFSDGWSVTESTRKVDLQKMDERVVEELNDDVAWRAEELVVWARVGRKRYVS